MFATRGSTKSIDLSPKFDDLKLKMMEAKIAASDSVALVSSIKVDSIKLGGASFRRKAI